MEPPTRTALSSTRGLPWSSLRVSGSRLDFRQYRNPSSSSGIHLPPSRRHPHHLVQYHTRLFPYPFPRPHTNAHLTTLTTGRCGSLSGPGCRQRTHVSTGSEVATPEGNPDEDEGRNTYGTRPGCRVDDSVRSLERGDPETGNRRGPHPSLGSEGGCQSPGSGSKSGGAV